MRKLIIAEIGEKRAGKGEVTKLLTELLPAGITAGHGRFSDPMGEILGIFGIPKNRHNYQLVACAINYPQKPWHQWDMPENTLIPTDAARLKRTLGILRLAVSNHNLAFLEECLLRPHETIASAWEGLQSGEEDGVFANAVKHIALEDPNDVVFMDGARWLADERMIRSLPPDEAILLYITASPEIRYERALRSTDKPDEQNKSWEKFMAEERAHTEIFIAQIGARADWIIQNNFGTAEELKPKVAECYESVVLPRLKKLGLA